MKEFHVLNLGAGWQSTALFVLSWKQDEPEHVPKFDLALFADTQDEPAAVYAHLDLLKSWNAMPIEIVSGGCLGDDLIAGTNSTGGRFASIPAYTKGDGDKREGQTKRQCTKEYKLDVMDLWLKREFLGLKPRQRIPKDIVIHKYVGFSYDEPGRVARLKARFAPVLESTANLNIFDDGPPRTERKPILWQKPHFPLFDMGWNRADCGAYLKGYDIHPPRSACVYCPYHSNEEWRHIRDNDPAGWQRAVDVDRQMREQDARCNQGLDKRLYVHRSCVPLAQANIEERENPLELYRTGSNADCEGGCFL